MQVASDNYEVVIKVNPLLLLDPINRQYTEWLKEALENSDHRDLWLLLTLGEYAYVVPIINVWSRNILHVVKVNSETLDIFFKFLAIKIFPL